MAQRIISGQKVAPIQLKRAKEMRREMTPAETKLWGQLRGNRLEGFHFRRQQVIEPYIVDFYCHEAGQVVEVEGVIHQDQEEYDRNRQHYLVSLGFKVIRFSNEEINESLDIVLKEILRVCNGEEE